MKASDKPVVIKDSKLLFLVRKLIGAAPSSSEIASSAESDSTTTEHVVTVLRSQYREYRRKDLSALRREVEAAMEQIVSEVNNSDENELVAGSNSSGKKRRKSLQSSNDADEQQEALYDQVAAANDRQMQDLEDKGGGLNASLRLNYARQSSQQRQQPDRDASSTGMNSESERGSQARTENEYATPKKRRKSSKLSRRGSSNNLSPARSNGSIKDAAFLNPVSRPKERYSDLGGMEQVVQQIRQLVEYPLIRPELYQHLGIDPPRGVLLRGPPGTGKTHLANAVAGELGVTYFCVSAPELVAGMSGESEGRIRDLFQAASDKAPAVIFLDELDAIAPKRSETGGGRAMEKRMVAQLLTCMDLLTPENNRQNAAVLVLAATNRPDAMDPGLRRAGRFDKEILLGVPDEDGREAILKAMTRGMRLSGNIDYKVLARRTPGYVGADVKSLTKEAAVVAINRIFRDVLKEQDVPLSSIGETSAFEQTEQTTAPCREVSSVTPLSSEQMEPLYITMDDFLEAIPHVQPSSKREGFATVPDVSWKDIGALQSLREELTMSVLEPIRSPEKFAALGLSLPAGVLLYGPPGCGKTLLAKAIAHESGANFISVKGPELLDKYVGESERAVRVVFERARSSSPCVVFFDELDSLVPKRGSDSGGGGGGVSERVVNQLLTEMDGMDSRRSVFVIAATNRPELIDPAMMRPGRLDKLLYVPLPTPEERVSILKALAANVQLGSDVDLQAIGMSWRATGYSGADCAALIREAGLAVLKEDSTSSCTSDDSHDTIGDQSNKTVTLCIASRHFDVAFASVVPSVSKKDQARYDSMHNRMARARSRVVLDNNNTSSSNLTLTPVREAATDKDGASDPVDEPKKSADGQGAGKS